MSRIPFIEARFFDPEETVDVIGRRFAEHLRKLRSPTLPSSEQVDDAVNGESDEPYWILHTEDTRAINRRTERILERRKLASGLSHLKREDRQRLELLRNGAALIAIPDEHHADVLAAELHTEMPWMAPATEAVWQAMRRSVREGWPGLRLPPLLLDGPPGIGKSYWARRLGEVIGVPTAVIEATGENASFGVVGSQRGWGGSCPGRVIETILQNRVANPLIVVDEIEKAGHPVSTKGQAFGLAEALLPLLEPMTAQRWSCPYYQVKFDMSWIGWVLTSNSHRSLPSPLLSRCPPIALRHLSVAELTAFIRREGARRELSEVATEALVDVLEHPSLRDVQPSLRVASRMLQRAADLESRPFHH